MALKYEHARTSQLDANTMPAPARLPRPQHGSPPPRRVSLALERARTAQAAQDDEESSLSPTEIAEVARNYEHARTSQLAHQSDDEDNTNESVEEDVPSYHMSVRSPSSRKAALGLSMISTTSTLSASAVSSTSLEGADSSLSMEERDEIMSAYEHARKSLSGDTTQGDVREHGPEVVLGSHPASPRSAPTEAKLSAARDDGPAPPMTDIGTAATYRDFTSTVAPHGATSGQDNDVYLGDYAGATSPRRSTSVSVASCAMSRSSQPVPSTTDTHASQTSETVWHI